MSYELTRTLDQLPALAAYLDPDLRYLFANEAHRRWRGIEPASLVGRKLPDVFAPLYPLLRAAMEEALAGRRGEVEIQAAPSGPYSFARVVFSPDLASDGSLRGIVAMATDLTERRALEARLRKSEGMFREAFTHAIIGKAIADPRGRMFQVNPALARMLDYPVDELIGMHFRDISHPDDIADELELFDALACGRSDGYQIEKRYIRRDGGIVHTLLAVFAVRDPDGGPTLAVAEIVDLTEQTRARQELAASAARLTLAAEAMDGGFWHYALDQDRFETSPALARFLAGGEAAPLDLAGFCAHILPEDRGEANLEALRTGAVERSVGRYRVTTADRGVRWVKCQRQLLRDAAGRPEAIVGVATDITEDVERQQAMLDQARADRLTGLLNRDGFEEEAEALLASSALDPEECGLLILDLDNFKLVNESFGCAAGDAVLIETARRLRARIGSGDLLCRVSGDRFAILVSSTDESELRALASRLVMDMDRPIAAGGQSVLVGATLGAAVGGAGGLRPLIRRANEQLRTAKTATRGGWRLAA